MEHLFYNSSSDRYAIGEVDLHAGYPVTVIREDGSKFDTRIEHDQAGWFLVGLEPDDHAIDGLTVVPF